MSNFLEISRCCIFHQILKDQLLRFPPPSVFCLHQIISRIFDKLPPGFVSPLSMSLCSNTQYESPQSHFQTPPPSFFSRIMCETLLSQSYNTSQIPMYFAIFVENHPCIFSRNLYQAPPLSIYLRKCLSAGFSVLVFP